MINNKGRYIYIFILAIVLHFMIKHLAKIGNIYDSFYIDILIYLLITTAVWEGNRYINNFLNVRIPLIPKPAKRILIQFSIGTLFTLVIAVVSAFIANSLFYKLSSTLKEDYITFTVLIPLVGFIIIYSIEISVRFFVEMRRSLIDVEKYKAESLQAQLQNLKNQINPHFLFNNLSVLSSLVYIDQSKAVNFIQQLSKVYRYLLDNKGYEVVTLEKELDFIKSYTYLLHIRFDKKLIIDFEIPSSRMKLLIPPMALQMLIENAIKHNEVSTENKLKIIITASENELTVSNNLQLRSNKEPSSKTGLQNIKDRYLYFTDQEVVVTESQSAFVVKVPLISDNS